MLKKKELLTFAQDRLAMALAIAFLLTMLILLAMTAINVRASDVQVPARYSGYGVTNIYRDQWFALLGFGLFAVLTFGSNSFLALKLHGVRRGLALGVLGMSVVIGLVSLVVAGSVFRLAAAVL